jgi:hypothetical protein
VRTKTAPAQPSPGQQSKKGSAFPPDRSRLRCLTVFILFISFLAFPPFSLRFVFLLLFARPRKTTRRSLHRASALDPLVSVCVSGCAAVRNLLPSSLSPILILQPFSELVSISDPFLSRSTRRETKPNKTKQDRTTITMLVKSVAALAALSLATGVAAEPLRPYKPAVMVKMSTRALFGVVRRDDAPGYQPSTEVCGVGPTCAAACGAGYETCASGDDEVHCFNPSAGEICCPTRSGSAFPPPLSDCVANDNPNHPLTQTSCILTDLSPAQAPATLATTAPLTARARRGAAPRANP